MDEKVVVALVGSLRNGSKTKTVAEEVIAASRDEGATRLINLRCYTVPAMNPSDGADIDGVEGIRATTAEAESVLLATPNYHGSYSGVLKNTLDHCGREELAGKAVGLVEVAGGRFPGSAARHLRTVSRTLKAWPLPYDVKVPDSKTRVTDGAVTDEEIAERIDRLGRDIVRCADVGATVADRSR